MHVVLGGAYNGKANWVRRTYNTDQTVQWISAYEKEAFPERISTKNSLLVIEGIEQWLYNEVTSGKWCRDNGTTIIAGWQAWVDAHKERQLVVIGTDISKGVVPLKAEKREWRDMTGWFYQDLVKVCGRFDLIWYGINQRLK